MLPDFGEEIVEINRSQDGDIIILAPLGRIDQDTSAAFQEELSKEIICGIKSARSRRALA